MVNANIDELLKEKIIELLKKNPKSKTKYQNLKGFINNACFDLLRK